MAFLWAQRGPEPLSIKVPIFCSRSSSTEYLAELWMYIVLIPVDLLRSKQHFGSLLLGHLVLGLSRLTYAFGQLTENEQRTQASWADS